MLQNRFWSIFLFTGILIIGLVVISSGGAAAANDATFEFKQEPGGALLAPEKVPENRRIGVFATVLNTGDTPGVAQVNFYVDGNPRGSASVNPPDLIGFDWKPPNYDLKYFPPDYPYFKTLKLTTQDDQVSKTVKVVESHYQLDVRASRGGDVQVSPHPDLGNLYKEGTTVNLTPQAADGWVFQEWWGNCASQGSFCNLTMYSDVYTAASFAKNESNFNVTSISANTPVKEGSTVNISTQITNTGVLNGSKQINLTTANISRNRFGLSNPGRRTVFGNPPAIAKTKDTKAIDLDPGESQNVTFPWPTSIGDAGNYTATISTEDAFQSTQITIKEARASWFGVPSPGDGAVDVSTDPSLEVSVMHEAADTMDVTFYNARSNQVIDSKSNVANGTTVSTTWNDLDYSSTYGWYANVTAAGETTQSPSWTFFTQANSTLLTDKVSDLSTDITGEPTMGKQLTTSFTYTINRQRDPADTALIIDRSGSMGTAASPQSSRTKMEVVKEAAKNYVDRMNVEAGDRVAIISFNDAARVDHAFSSDKESLKNAIDSLWDDGGTCIGCAIDKARTELNWGTDAQKILPVMSDGRANAYSGGSGPGEAADDARIDGISKIHGVMYGTQPDTTEMENITTDTANGCVKDVQEENNDEDMCWFALTSGTLNQVYEDIQPDPNVTINAILPPHAHVLNTNSFTDTETLANGNQLYRVEAPGDEDTHTIDFHWYPGTTGDNISTKTGQSNLQFETEAGSSTERFPNQPEKTNINYVDLVTTKGFVTPSSNHVNISVTIENQGTATSPATELAVYQNNPSEPEAMYKTIPSIDPSNKTTVRWTFLDTSRSVLQSDTIFAQADWDGKFGEDGTILEPNEDNNIIEMAPFEVSILSPTQDTWQRTTFNVRTAFNFLGSSLSNCKYTVTDDGTVTDTGSLDCSNPPTTDTFQVTVPTMCSEGTNTCNITVQAEDNAGNLVTDNQQYSIDRSPPTVTCQNCLTPNPSTIDAQMTIEPQVTDQLSGVNNILICEDQDCSQIICSNPPCTLTRSEPTTVQLYVQATDQVGNTDTTGIGQATFGLPVGSFCRSNTQCVTGQCSGNQCLPRRIPPGITILDD